MTKPIRLGLIGCGGIVQLVHARAYQSLTDTVKVVAIADVLDENLQQIGQTFGVPLDQRYADYRDMLASAGIDVVTVATPHFLHAEHAIDAASAGVAVISEKPMATSLAEADTILDAVERNKVPYGVVHNYLYTLAMQEGFAQRAKLGASIFGRAAGMGLKPADFSTEHSDPAQAWRASKAKGGGCIGDSSYHEIYSVNALMDSPARYVEARVKTLSIDVDVDDIAMLLCEHENGAVSTVSSAWCVPDIDTGWCEIHTNEGSLRIRHRKNTPDSLMRYTREDDWQYLEIPGRSDPEFNDPTGHVGYFTATFDALASGRELPISGKHGRHNLAIIEAARMATEQRQSVDLETLKRS
jgi:predicted dehydrogenase